MWLGEGKTSGLTDKVAELFEPESKKLHNNLT